MDARAYLTQAKATKRIIRVARYERDRCVGRGYAIIVDEAQLIAVMLEDCGDPDNSRVRAGDLVQYAMYADAELRIEGEPADIRR